MNFDHYQPYLGSYSRALRKEMTKAEACLWKYALKNRARQGVQFRRQKPIGNFIVDFLASELKLVIEVDGITHTYETVTIKDKSKDEYLASLGYRVLRFTDTEILTGINSVIIHIDDAITELQNK